METVKTMNQLSKAELDKPELSLNSEGYVGLFGARGEMIQSSSHAFIKGKIDYTHAVCWKVPYDEPFIGPNAVELKEELTKKIIGGVIEKNERGERVEDPSLLNLIISDISQWAKDQMILKGSDYHVAEFKEVYDYRYSVAAVVANTAVYLEVSYI